MKTSKLLDDDAHLVACLGELSFQDGKSLNQSSRKGGDTELVDSSTGEYTLDQHVYMAFVGD